MARKEIDHLRNLIKYTIENYSGDPDDLEWSTEEIQTLLSECESLEARIKELLARQDWYETIIKELEEGLAYSKNELECSGLYFTHPTLVKLRKLIEKGGEDG